MRKNTNNLKDNKHIFIQKSISKVINRIQFKKHFLAGILKTIDSW